MRPNCSRRPWARNGCRATLDRSRKGMAPVRLDDSRAGRDPPWASGRAAGVVGACWQDLPPYGPVMRSLGLPDTASCTSDSTVVGKVAVALFPVSGTFTCLCPSTFGFVVCLP